MSWTVTHPIEKEPGIQVRMELIAGEAFKEVERVLVSSLRKRKTKNFLNNWHKAVKLFESYF